MMDVLFQCGIPFDFPSFRFSELGAITASWHLLHSAGGFRIARVLHDHSLLIVPSGHAIMRDVLSALEGLGPSKALHLSAFSRSLLNHLIALKLRFEQHITSCVSYRQFFR